MKTQIETNKTKVLLIGVTKFYDDNTIHAIPNVKRNIVLMKKMFLSNNVLNITEEDITVSLNETKTDIERKLIQVSREAKNHNFTLFVYYAGHGLLSIQNYKLYLTASNTTNQYLESDGIHISHFREIIESSRAGRKFIILDACHSGAVHNAMNTTSSQFQAELNQFTGSYIMSSSSQNDSSRYSLENPNMPTYFTAEFLKVLQNGIVNNKPFLTLRDIFEEIQSSFRVNGLPMPQQSAYQNADTMHFTVNNSFVESEKTESNFEVSENRIVINFEKNNSLKYFLISKLISVLV
jgi:hypothetical protein